jgi:histidyl-tRNA synthetase
VQADAEMCMMMSDTLEALGIKRGDYVIRVNNRKVLDGVLEAIGLGGDDKAAQRLNVLRAIDKLDKFGPEGVALLLGPGRKDESGDFTKGVGLEQGQIDKLLGFMSILQSAEAALDSHPLVQNPVPGVEIDGPKAVRGAIFDTLHNNFKDSPTGVEGVFELKQIWQLVEAAGYQSDRIKIDPSVVRGLEYYTGPVYEVELTFPVTNEGGQVVRFGSVAGGGRYDGLVGRFRPEPVPATGFSIGVSRLYSALKAVKSPIVDNKAELPLVVVTAMDNKSPEFMPGYQAMVSELRKATAETGKPLCRADLYLGSSGFNAQMKYADRRGAVCAIIQGSSEREAGTVIIKDLILGAELAAASRDMKDSAEHKAKQAEAQFAVPAAELVEGVKRVLARHG